MMNSSKLGTCIFVATLIGAHCGAAQAASAPTVQPTIWAEHPDVAQFEKMENARIAAARHSIAKLVAAKGVRTIQNTLEPYDEALRQLNAAGDLAGVMVQVHPDENFRNHATTINTRVGGEATALSLNQAVYHALQKLDFSKEDAATQYYVKRQLLEYRLAGVDKDLKTRNRLKKLQDHLTEAQAIFERNIADGVSPVEVANAAELDGLPADFIGNHKPDAQGKIHLTTNFVDALPVLSFAKSDDLRRRMWVAFVSRAYPKNQEVLKDMMQTRYEIAQLLGYKSWADYNAADNMVVNGATIEKFLDEMGSAMLPNAQREAAMLLTEKRKTAPDAKEVFSYENFYLKELVRRAQYDFDSSSVRPYLAYDKVKQGVLDTAATLFHVTFKRESDVRSWDPAVETWDVYEGAGGKMIGRFYLDMHPRKGKFGVAENSNLLDGKRGVQLPETVLVCSFPEPTATDPGLMEIRDVETFFHEFGHLMHHILGGQQQWVGVSGITMESDFDEAPSLMLEEWMKSQQVLASFARHYQTGEVIPPELVAKMNRASAFGRSQLVSDQIRYSLISYDLYKDDPGNIDIGATAAKILSGDKLITPLDADERFPSQFNHLANYSSAYYKYMWDMVIAEDFFQQFNQQNLLDTTVSMRYRKTVLEPGGSMSANDLVKNFLGRPQNTAAIQKWAGKEFEVAP
jgi:thimet oligopeptidase